MNVDDFIFSFDGLSAFRNVEAFLPGMEAEAVNRIIDGRSKSLFPFSSIFEVDLNHIPRGQVK